MFHPIKRIVIGNSNRPLNQTIPTEHIRNIISNVVFFLPDLKDSRGNFIKWIGLTIKKQTKDNIIINVLGSP